MAYNLTGVTEANNLAEIGSAMNTMSGGILAGFFLLVFFILIFIVFRNEDTAVVFVADSFLTTIVCAIMVFALRWLSFEAFGVCLVLVVGSILFYASSRD